jgi:hypothetical protein
MKKMGTILPARVSHWSNFSIVPSTRALTEANPQMIVDKLSIPTMKDELPLFLANIFRSLLKTQGLRRIRFRLQ